jgi:hypothetical protein
MPRAPIEQQWTTCIVAALRQLGRPARVDEIEPIAGDLRGEYLEGLTPEQSVSEMLQLHCANGPQGPRGRAIFFKCAEPATYDLVERRQPQP